jgi:hypothetical protein
LEPTTNLDYVFAKRETRKVGNGGEITYMGSVYVPRDSRVLLSAQMTAEVRETFSGQVIVWRDGKAVELRKIERQLRRSTNQERAEPTNKTPKKPSPDHPWRRGFGNGAKRRNAGASVSAY